MIITTEEQEETTTYLNSYFNLLCSFFDYNNNTEWFKEEAKLDIAIDAVRAGNYKDDDELLRYINSCIRCVEEMNEF